MTTSFANITKGHWKEAARANFAGLLLAIICAALVPWCWLSASTGVSAGFDDLPILLRSSWSA